MADVVRDRAGDVVSNPPTKATSIHPDEVRKRVAGIPFWYHRIMLPGGIVTPGRAPMDIDTHGVPKDLTGLRVLDIGTWDGFWTFQSLKRGAREVVAIDDFTDSVGGVRPIDRPPFETFDLCRNALGYGEDRCKRFDMNVYHISPQQLGTFDIVLFFGMIYRLRHPLLALDLISEVCTGQLFIESAILDDYSVYRGGIDRGYDGPQVVSEFYSGDQYGGNASNWFVPTLWCLAEWVRSAKFTDVKFWKLMENPPQLPMCRGFVSARKAQT